MLLSLIVSVFAFAGIPAEYEVPVPAELAAYSRFAMAPVEVRAKGDEVRVKYCLPLLLTGVRNEIELRGSREDGVFRLSGEHAEAECDGFEPGRQCRVEYRNLRVDLARAEAELDQLALPENDRAGVLAVIKRFMGYKQAAALPEVFFALAREGGDMQGIVHFGIPASARAK